jgi:YVTN family beta-propeller protein
VLTTLTTGPITNHVNIVRNANGQFAYITIGGLNEVKVFRTSDFAQVATIPVGALPHGIWPSGDGTRVYVGLENADGMTGIDTLTNKVIATSPIGQTPQAIVYVPNAVPTGPGTDGLEPLGVAGQATRFFLASRTNKSAAGRKAPTSLTLFDQGIVQILEAAVTGLQPKQTYVLAFSRRPDGSGPLEPLSAFTTNPAGAAIVNTTGPVRQIVRGENGYTRRYFVIAPATMGVSGTTVQYCAPSMDGCTEQRKMSQVGSPVQVQAL